MFSNTDAEYLLKLEKLLVDPKQEIDLRNKKNRIELFSPSDQDYKFLIEIRSNEKFVLKTSVHHQENISFVGLLRIDFKGGHRNPTNIIDTVPENLRKYVNKWFTLEEPHMHVYVEGYRPLSWAIPLKDTDFPIQELSDKSDITDLILKFAQKINLTSKLNIQNSIF